MTEQPKGELVCKASEIQVKQALRILIDDYPVAVVKDSMGEIHAIGDTCSHADISLSEGEVEGCLIECWGTVPSSTCAAASRFSCRPTILCPSLP
jgi:3-phenylpropionate/trans-cinnamate dioxygenase ferredoxin subunit